MIASLYHMPSDERSGVICSRPFEILLVARATFEPEHMRREDMRVQFDVVVLPLPQVVRPADEVVDGEGMRRVDTELGHGHPNGSRLSVMRVDAGDHDDD